MSHLTDEQLDALLEAEAPDDIHLAQCEPCRRRLRGRQALRHRLRETFKAVQPPASLAQRIQQAVAETPQRAPSTASPPTKHSWRLWAGGLSGLAACLLTVLVLRGPLLTETGYADLAQIHQHSITAGEDFVAQSDPNALAAHFRKELGFNPRLPQLDRGLRLRGCCVRHFRGQIVGSYVVDTETGSISVAVVKESPAEIGMVALSATEETPFFHSRYTNCNMVATVLDGLTYCAIGNVDTANLVSLLEQLVDPDTSAH